MECPGSETFVGCWERKNLRPRENTLIDIKTTIQDPFFLQPGLSCTGNGLVRWALVGLRRKADPGEKGKRTEMPVKDY
jgi:hypothetical protein